MFCKQWTTALRRCLTTNVPTDHDVVIVGGGLMGCSTAYHLISHDPSLRVCIVEKDPSVSCTLHCVMHSSYGSIDTIDFLLQLYVYSVLLIESI